MMPVALLSWLFGTEDVPIDIWRRPAIARQSETPNYQLCLIIFLPPLATVKVADDQKMIYEIFGVYSFAHPK
jgi:hypothetical protein